MSRLRYCAALLAALALPSIGALAQTPSVPSTALPSRTPPTLPPAASPTVPARVAPAVGTSPTVSSPAASSPAATPTTTAAGPKIDINAASEQEIATLPGIGPATAKAIVAGRPWDDLNTLASKKIMAQPVFERNKDRFALANINKSSAADMAKTLPGIGDKTAPKIVNGRPYTGPQDLVTKKVLTQGQFNKIKDLIAY